MSRTAELSDGPTARISVVVGVLVDQQQRVLISQRPSGKHMAGMWEFPGGKREEGESAWSALHRELQEELGVEISTAEPVLDLEHTYPDRTVWLDVWWVAAWSGEPRALEGQGLRWVAPEELATAALLPADAPIVTAVIQRLESLSTGQDRT